MDSNRYCTGCSSTLSASDFYRKNGKPVGQCKTCVNAASKAWVKANPEARKASANKWARANFATKYGITNKQYNQMLEDQDGKCLICHETPDERLRIDHDHVTGQVRGLLCTCCNNVLGMANDSRSLIEAAIAYLNQHETVQD